MQFHAIADNRCGRAYFHAVVLQGIQQLANNRGVDGWQVTLQIYHRIELPLRVEFLDCAVNAIRPGRKLRISQHGSASGSADDLRDFLVSRRHKHRAISASTPRRHTWTIIGCPLMSARAFRLSLVECKRVGITIKGLMLVSMSLLIAVPAHHCAESAASEVSALWDYCVVGTPPHKISKDHHRRDAGQCK